MTVEVRHRRRSDARDNRERILAVARLAFATDGLDVPIREIARRAQLGPATVYRHFPTKEALLAAAFAEQMAACSAILEEGLAHPDPWLGFRLIVEKLMETHALDRGFARAFVTQLPAEAGFAADRARTLRMAAEIVDRARTAGRLRPDFVLDDLILALMANEGIRADDPTTRVAAARRFAALMLQSFQATPSRTPLPPPVRLPLPTHEIPHSRS
ncbi:AcrR family transcriptional regulator [Catenuloplanes nepalensis]|uniref:AcrR family transcriptional regulator n=1 Tax=Catenuloplanes nepalensis TaxID=587533 RepID=A0ABT9MQU6_9ACTN|nr:TetR/AcrR family transcriptional regulator [Catenuloplanes nepalensis]MDP9793805.1 AcrR family transcriptional regulator [Catenuloplanes nepalensis]